jgi:hypothetical protein
MLEESEGGGEAGSMPESAIGSSVDIVSGSKGSNTSDTEWLAHFFFFFCIISS